MGKTGSLEKPPETVWRKQANFCGFAHAENLQKSICGRTRKIATGNLYGRYKFSINSPGGNY